MIIGPENYAINRNMQPTCKAIKWNTLDSLVYSGFLLIAY